MATKNETKYGSCQNQECMNYGMSSVIPADGNCPMCHHPMKPETEEIGGGDDFGGTDNGLIGGGGNDNKKLIAIIAGVIAALCILGVVLYLLLGGKPKPEIVILNQQQLELFFDGDPTTAKLEATILPEEAAAEAILLWQVEGTAATVDGGVVTAKEEGVATVTVKVEGVEGVTATCTVNVKKAPVPDVDVESLTVAEPTIELMVDSLKQLTITKTPEESDETIEWSSSNDSVAVVDASNIVMAKGEGVAVLTAKTSRTGKTVAVAVTVKKPEPKKEESKGGGKKTSDGNSGSISVLGGHGVYTGGMSGGKPHGNGVVRIKSSFTVAGEYIPAGSRIEGVFREGYVNLGTLFTPDGDAIAIKDLKVK